MEPPDYLDRAKVIQWGWSGRTPFGTIGNTEDSSLIEIFGLAICQYSNSPSYYRFSCTKDWEVEQDATYNSIQDAINQLPEQYKNVLCTWQQK